MTFVPGCRHDVFVSYAHVDDQPTPGTDEGWVTTFVKGLRVLLTQKLGRQDACSLWVDHRLSRNVEITPEIHGHLSSTAIFVVVLSQGYLASDWCRRERDSFLRVIQERADRGRRIFVVELDRMDDGERPPELSDLLGYRFWVTDREGKPPRLLGMPKPHPGEPVYYDVLNDLSHDLAKELRRLRAAEATSPIKDSAQNVRQSTVFLADVTDDLDTLGEQVRRYLAQAGVRVLPETCYSYEPRSFRTAVERDLAKSDLFVQLLSQIPGKRPPDLPQGYTRLQYDIALASGKPIYQWRPPDLDLSAVHDPEQQALLRLGTVLSMGLEEFKAEVLRQVRREPRSPTSIDPDPLVFVNAEENDLPLASGICEILDRSGFGYALPLQSEKPAENRIAFEEYLLHCDAVIIIYGQVDVKWVSDQLLSIRKIIWRREQPLTSFAVYDGPPTEKPPLTFRLPGMQVLQCRDAMNESALQVVLQAARQRASS
jgi:hypothetical protein